MLGWWLEAVGQGGTTPVGGKWGVKTGGKR